MRWRHNLFSAPVRTANDVGGDRRERTILMESPTPLGEVDDPDGDPDSVSVRIDEIEPAVLRALADLEESRRSGAITETEYQQRRENLLGDDGF